MLRWLTPVFRSKIDLLVRVRYSNPLPAPPCPPKLLDIPTNPMRYARPEFLETLANDTPLPMIVDAECGMPLDLGLWECLWTDDGDNSGECCTWFDPGCSLPFASLQQPERVFWGFLIALSPDPKHLPKLDPKDQVLLGDSAVGSSLFASSSTTGSSSSHAVPTVTWLRKTEYITSREGSNRPSSTTDQYVPYSRCQNVDDYESHSYKKEESGRKFCRHFKVGSNTRHRGIL